MKTHRFNKFGLMICSILFLSSCNILELEYKRVTYLIERDALNTFDLMLTQGQKSEFNKKITTADFGLSTCDTFNRVIVKDIYINLKPGQFNECDNLDVRLIVYSSQRQFNAPLMLENTYTKQSIDEAYDEKFIDLQEFINKELKDTGSINFYLTVTCKYENDVLDFSPEITYKGLLDYSVCEETFAILDLESCKRCE